MRSEKGRLPAERVANGRSCRRAGIVTPGRPLTVGRGFGSGYVICRG
jgi:hypothetical protein